MAKICVDLTVRTVIDSKEININDIIYNLDVNIATDKDGVRVTNLGVVDYDIPDSDVI